VKRKDGEGGKNKSNIGTEKKKKGTRDKKKHGKRKEEGVRGKTEEEEERSCPMGGRGFKERD